VVSLGPFLRARRAAVGPESVGVPVAGYRRVAGLRREEVALLAGVSVDYYTRLEQGRERHPSAQVLDALTRAFGLDDDGRQHLFRLAGLAPRSSAAGQAVAPDLLRLLDTWPEHPSFVLNRTLDVLARNELGAALHSGFAEPDNLIRMTFLAPQGREFFVDWDRAVHAGVANLRLAAGHDPNDPRLRELVTELSEHSAEFRETWRDQDARGKSHEAKQLRHPDVGLLTLSFQAFDVRSAPGQQLIVYQAEPGSPSEQALALLGSIAATRRAESERAETPRSG
jgi:transcriptional regulator with XRE-family HTH domain